VPITHLPENPSLENLRKRAKQLRTDARAGDAGSLALVREFHPRGAVPPGEISLADAQLVIARRFGFPSWAKLKQHLAVVDRFTFDPLSTSDEGEARAAERFIHLACLTYGRWDKSWVAKAAELLRDHPELARADIYAASAAGDAVAVRDLLAGDQALASARGGPFGWEPLLYACYSRLEDFDGHSTLAVARALLGAGADPNAGFLWRGNVPPFTALTAAFGEGEDGSQQIPHPNRDVLARLLLDAGADPNDGQTLYNCHFRRSDHHFELLLPYGLGTDRNGPWYRRLGDRLHSPARLLVEELWAAARKGYAARVYLLVEHGADVNTPGLRDGLTPWEAAIQLGNTEIAEYLVARGARKSELDPEEAFAVAVVAGRREDARALLAAHPALLDQLGRDGRCELLHRAVEANRPEGVRLMADLGFEMTCTTKHKNVGMYRAVTPLHNAAGVGNLEMVKLLVELGADPNARDVSYSATPLGWAAHGEHQEVVDYLRPLTAEEATS
jgi:ankyrin repeat protein